MAFGVGVSVTGLLLSLVAGSSLIAGTLIDYYRVPSAWAYAYPLIIDFIAFLCVCYGGVEVLKSAGRPGYRLARAVCSVLFIIVAVRYFFHVIVCFAPPPGYY